MALAFQDVRPSTRPKLPQGKPARKHLPASVKPKTPGKIVTLPKAVKPKPPPPKPTNIQQTVYAALRKRGLSQAQTAGILGNIQNESTFRVEIAAPDTGGTTSYGLIQWNSGGLGAGGVGPGLVTGNYAKDFTDQIDNIAAQAKRINLTSSSPQAAAVQWANQIEGCTGCNPGGSQSNARAGNALTFYAQSLTQNWEQYVPGFTFPAKGSAAPPSSAFVPVPSTSAGSFPVNVPTGNARPANRQSVPTSGTRMSVLTTAAPAAPFASSGGVPVSSGSLTGNVTGNALPGFTPSTQGPAAPKASVGALLVGAAALGGLVWYLAKRS